MPTNDHLVIVPMLYSWVPQTVMSFVYDFFMQSVSSVVDLIVQTSKQGKRWNSRIKNAK